VGFGLDPHSSACGSICQGMPQIPQRIGKQRGRPYPLTLLHRRGSGFRRSCYTLLAICLHLLTATIMAFAAAISVPAVWELILAVFREPVTELMNALS
jgi:hypothetical protein